MVRESKCLQEEGGGTDGLVPEGDYSNIPDAQEGGVPSFQESRSSREEDE